LYQEVLLEYNGQTPHLWSSATPGMTVYMFLLFSLQLGELLCYVAHFRYLANHDQSMLSKSVISQETFQKRKRLNIFSMSGQMYGFLTR
jgi:hypothetical protein